MATGSYLYAVVDGGPDVDVSAPGVDGAAVTAVVEGDLAAVVSESAARKVRPERKRLSAHFEVLRQLMRERAVLPMAFGVIADSPEAVRAILRHNADSFRGQLDRVRGKVEMGLKIAWEVPNIFEHFVAAEPELRQLRDRFFAGGRKQTQDEMIDLGREFEAARTRRRGEFLDRAQVVLAAVAAEVKDLKPRGEAEILNLACLVPADGRDAFEAAVGAFAESLDDTFAFGLSGPFPPHNFVEMHLEPPDEDE